MTLAGDYNRKLGGLLVLESLEPQPRLLEITNLLLNYGGVLACERVSRENILLVIYNRQLTLGDTIADVEDSFRRMSFANLLHPNLGHTAKVLVNVERGDHFRAMAIGLHVGPVASKVLVARDRYGGERSSILGASTRRWVRHIRTNDHCGNGIINLLWIELREHHGLCDTC